MILARLSPDNLGQGNCQPSRLLTRQTRDVLPVWPMSAGGLVRRFITAVHTWLSACGRLGPACAIVLAVVAAGCTAAPSSTSASGSSGIVTAAVPRTDGPRVCHQLAGSTPIRQLPSAVELQSDARLGPQARAAIAAAVSQLIQIARATASPLSVDLDRAAAGLKPLENPGIPSAAQEAVVVKALTTLGKRVQGECDFSVG
jgi:hypothetical protein